GVRLGPGVPLRPTQPGSRRQPLPHPAVRARRRPRPRAPAPALTRFSPSPRLGTVADVATTGAPTEPHVRDDAELERLWLDETSWVDVARGWLAGADEVYRALLDAVPWQQGRIYRYDHWVDEPRLGWMWQVGRPAPHP